MRKSRRQYAEKVFETGKPCRFEDENRGTYFDNIFYPVLDEQGRVTKIAIQVMDITEQKQAEDKLKKSAHYFNKAQQIANFGSWVLDVKTNRVEFSDNMFNILGIKREEFVGTPEYTNSLVKPEYRSKVQECYEDLLIRHRPTVMEYSIVRPDGSVRHLWGNGEVEFDENGNPVVWVSVDGQFEERAVVIGISNGLQTEILEGLTEGEMVSVQRHGTNELGGLFG